MNKSLFKRRFGKSPADFNSIEEINVFVEKKLGHNLEAKRLYPNLVSTRGCILPIKKISADEVIDNALNNDD